MGSLTTASKDSHHHEYGSRSRQVAHLVLSPRVVAIPEP